MWEACHKQRTSDALKSKWVRFLETSVAVGACSIFYQYVTDRIFKAMIMQHFPVSAKAYDQNETGLRYEEMNALRYAAGHVPRALRTKRQRRSYPLMEELVLCLYEMTEDDGHEEKSESEDWVNLVDRGGLKHVNNATYTYTVGS